MPDTPRLYDQDAPTLATATIEPVDGVFGFDPATCGLAIRRFAEYAEESPARWRAPREGVWLFQRAHSYTNNDYRIHDTAADIQPEHGRHKLNDLATRHGFEAPFVSSFGVNEVGVVTVVDKRLRWCRGDASKAEMTAAGRRFAAVEFSITAHNAARFSVYGCDRYAKPVVQIAADPAASGGVVNYLWCTELGTDPAGTSVAALIDGIAETLAEIAAASGPTRESFATVESVTVPKAECAGFTRPLTEMVGATLDFWKITAASQSLRMCLDALGAEAAAVTSMVSLARGIPAPAPQKSRIVIGDTGPLLVWFTEAQSQLPICVFVLTPEAYTTT